MFFLTFKDPKLIKAVKQDIQFSGHQSCHFKRCTIDTVYKLFDRAGIQEASAFLFIQNHLFTQEFAYADWSSKFQAPINPARASIPCGVCGSSGKSNKVLTIALRKYEGFGWDVTKAKRLLWCLIILNHRTWYQVPLQNIGPKWPLPVESRDISSVMDHHRVFQPFVHNTHSADVHLDVCN